MRRLRSTLIRLAGLFRKRRRERDMAEELESHLQMHIDDNLRRGMTPREARRQALIKLGGLEQVKEECRDTWGIRVLNELVQDIRYGFRQLRRNPGFTAVAVLTLALGIGANTAIFSVVDGVLLAPLPYAQPNRLVVVWESNLHFGWHVAISYLNFRDWQHKTHAFQGIAAFTFQGRELTKPGTPAHVQAKEIPSGFFKTLGVNLVLGRGFTALEDRQGGVPVAVISNRLWRERFSKSSHVLGQSVILDGVDYTVVGVAPPGLDFYGHTDVFTPLGQGNPATLDERGSHNMLAVGRLKSGVSIEEAQAEMSTIQRGLDKLYPDVDKGLGITLVPLKREMVGGLRQTLLLLFGAVGLVLLIACANVANLLLARSAARAHEFAIRSSLGASRIRVVRQLLTESALLSLPGGGLGLLIAVSGVKPVLAMVPESIPRSETISLNLPVLLFALIVAIVAGALFGLGPALKNSKADLEGALREGGRTSSGGRHRAQSSLVVLQMAFTLVLLVGAGLLLRTIRHLWHVDPGFDTHHLITFKVGVSPSLTKTASRTRTAYRQLLARIREVPGIKGADFTSSIPLTGQAGQAPFWIDERKPPDPQTAPRTLFFLTGPDYLRTMGIPLLQGRFFTSEDTNKSPCVVAIDTVFARTYFPHKNPLNETLTAGFEKPFVGPCRIVGVVGHVKNAGLGKPNSPTQAQAYYSLYQDPDRWVPVNFPDTTMIIRTSQAPTTMMPLIKKAVYGVERGQPVYDVRTMDEIASTSMASERFPTILLGIFAALALLLVCVGIYGVILYSVNRRTHEMGIRMALGAQRRDVLRMVVGQGLKLALIGVAIGIAGALALTRFLASLLYGVKPTDPLTFAAVSLILIAVALVACYIPARRAAKVDPMVALRYE